LVGVALSATLAVVRAGSDVRLRWVRPNEGGGLLEGPVPSKLDSDHEVMVINVYGSLFFAGARTLGEQLPIPDGADRPVVILRLRGHSHVGATLVNVLDEYVGKLKAAGGRLYLTGLEPHLMEPLTAVCELAGDKDTALYAATDRLGASTRQAVKDATAWRYDGHANNAEDAEGIIRTG
jgi:SulP family sulfate permease